MKTNKKLLILTSMVILFPMLWGLMIWSQLPNQIPIHFNAAGHPRHCVYPYDVLLSIKSEKSLV